MAQLEQRQSKGRRSEDDKKCPKEAEIDALVKSMEVQSVKMEDIADDISEIKEELARRESKIDEIAKMNTKLEVITDYVNKSKGAVSMGNKAIVILIALTGAGAAVITGIVAVFKGDV